MPLNVNALQTAIHTAFKKAKDTPPPADPSQSDQVQEKILTDLARDISAAVNTFVTGGDVANVTVSVTDLTNNPIGKGTQTGFGRIQ